MSGGYTPVPATTILLKRSSLALTTPRQKVKLELDDEVDRPFLKWTGGKQWLARLLPEIVPDSFEGTFYEPFMGGASAFFALQPSFACLSDVNPNLVRAFKAVRDAVEDVIKGLERLENSTATFDRVKHSKPTNAVEEAVRLIYLNRTSFNGIYRVNRKGEFNVPFGYYSNPAICDPERLRHASSRLARARITCCDFEKSIAEATRGDLVYLDPPYITGHTNNGFLKYNAKLFSWDDECRLASAALTLARSGVHVIISHAEFPPVLRLYRGFYCYSVNRLSLIAGRGGRRGSIQEALITSFPILDIEAELIYGS